MRKKRSDALNVSQIFVLKHSSGPKLFQKNLNSSFSQAVSGSQVGSDAYNNTWPELPTDSKFSKYRDKERQVEVKVENENAGESCDNGVGGSNTNFPSLQASKKKKSRTDVKPLSNQFFHPVTSQESNILVKTRHFLSKGGKPKRNDPISIDIESAIELSKCRQKKDLKRLDKKRPRQLNATNCGGNALDSANPIRKKGKVRPNKKKKLTSLRKMIDKLKSKPAEERDIQGALCKQLDGVSLSKEQFDKIAKAKLHTSKFREYCKNFATRELVESVKELVVTVRGFQDRMYKKDEVKARARRRYAVGFHECWKLLKANSFKLVIIATNVERNEALLEKINEFVTESIRQGVPVIFAGTCTDLSFWLFKKNRTCIIGIVNYDGANEIYNKMMTLFERDKAEYELKLSQIIEDEVNSVDDVAEELRSKMLKKLRTD